MKNKFKAYVKREKKVLSVTRLQLVPEGIAFTTDHEKPYVTVDGWCDIFPLNEIVLMEYTGVNETLNTTKRIYQHEIVCLTFADPDKFIFEQGFHFTGVAQQINGQWMVVNNEGEEPLFSEDTIARVIGNKFEHPDLIRGLADEV